MGRFSEIVSSYHMFNHTGNVFEKLSRKEDSYATRFQANALAETTDPVNKKNELAAEVWDRFAPIEALQYVIYLYLEHFSSVLTNNTLYTQHANLEEWFMCDCQDTKLQTVLESLPDYVSAALGS